MSQNPPDDMDLGSEDAKEETLEVDPFAAEDIAGTFAHTSADERPEDSSKGDTVQALEEGFEEKSVATGTVSSKPKPHSLVEELLSNQLDGIEIRWGRKEVKKARDEELEGHLLRTQRDLNELMAWKEQLRLLTVSYMVPGPYYESWTKEANLFFRRLVVISKRLESQKKQKRA